MIRSLKLFTGDSRALLAGALGFLLLAMISATASAESRWDQSRLQREEGSTYLEDFLPRGEKLKVPVVDNTQIYYTPEFKRYLGTLRPKQTVEVIAILGKGEAFRVRGKAQQGDVAGWIKREALPDLPEKLVEDLIKAGERFTAVEALIAEKSVAIGMTEAEVGRSLGKPERMSSKVSGREGSTAEWHYITYDMIPQEVTGYDRYGRLVTSTQYVKVPSGKMRVVFKEGVVEEIERSEGIDEDAVGTVKIVQRPILLTY